MSDSKVYHLNIESADENGNLGTLANAYGDLDIINYVAGKAAKALKGVTEDVAVTLVESLHVGGPAGRKVLSVTADGDSVADLLRKRIKNERRADQSAVLATAPVGGDE